jgi:hypothetical protein
MATTHSRVSVYSSSNINTVYTNSTAKPQRIILTDMMFAADSGYYSSDMGNVTYYVVKRSDNVSNAMTSTIFYGYIQYPYSMWLNFNSSLGATSGIATAGNNQVGMSHVYQQSNTYANTPWSNISYYLTPNMNNSGQSATNGMGQCVLYPGDTLRIAVNKYGTAYMDFLIMSE